MPAQSKPFIATKPKRKVAIIGAGISGMICALLLDKKKFDVTVLEKEAEPGGHLLSTYIGGYTFDHVGAHILFSKNSEVLNFIINLLAPNLYKWKRNNQISYKNRLIKYPFENDLASLPVPDRYAALSDYLFNKNKTKNPKNLKEWLLDVFGQSICEQYLFPYNEKVWNIPVEDLSMIWAERIPKPPVEDVIKSALGWKTEGYTHQLFFYYPKYGGINAFNKAVAQLISPHIQVNSKVSRLTKASKGWKIQYQTGKSEDYDLVINTAPIHELVKIAQLPFTKRERQAIRDLVQNPLITVSIGVNKPDPNHFTAIYFPEKEFLVNRLAYNGVFSPYNDPVGKHGMVAEITCRPNDQAWSKMSDAAIAEHVVAGLEQRGLLARDNIEQLIVKRLPYAYVVYDKYYTKNQPIAVKAFNRHQNLYMFGRFAEHLYSNTDKIIEDAQVLISKLNGKPTALPNQKKIERLRVQNGFQWPGLPKDFTPPATHLLDQNMYVPPPPENYAKLGRIAITMPVYNEEDVIEQVIREFHEVVRQLPKAKLIVSEDGSTDNTKQILTALQRELPRLEARMSPDRAGAAQGQRNALQAAAEWGDVVIISDSDGQHRAEDIYNLLDAMMTGTDLATGRKMNRHDPVFRLIGSRLWNFYIRIMFGLKTRDVNSGFKAIRRPVIRKILTKNHTFPECVLTEFTARARGANYKIKEVPVQHRARFGEARAWNVKKIPSIAWNLFKASFVLRQQIKEKS